MPNASDVHGTVFKNGTATNLARVVGADGANITQADIASGVYSIYLLNDQDADSRTAVTNHSAVALVVADVFFDTLQTDSIWTKDATGYNFKHTPAISADAAFAIADRAYLVEYTLTPSSGEVIFIRFRVRSI